VIQNGRCNTLLGGKCQAFGVGAVADDGSDAGAKSVLPNVALGDLHNGRHVGTRARDQNNDVFHTGPNYDPDPH
jgi:hypothetical protein